MSERARPALRRLTATAAVLAVALAGVGAGCGSGGSSSTASSASATTPSGAAASGGGGAAKPASEKASCGSSTASAGASEAQSTAHGDIPDNQQFLTYKNASAGYSISYPEGWARTGSGSNVTFQDKGNTVTAKVAAGPKPTPSSVAKQLTGEAKADPCLTPGAPKSLAVGPNQAIKVTYTTEGQKSAVTGQRPKITVDRYVYFANGKVATLDLATPVGVDNVDAYRMISESFRWG
jgi:hypothetical protein